MPAEVVGGNWAILPVGNEEKATIGKVGSGLYKQAARKGGEEVYFKRRGVTRDDGSIPVVALTPTQMKQERKRLEQKLMERTPADVVVNNDEEMVGIVVDTDKTDHYYSRQHVRHIDR